MSALSDYPDLEAAIQLYFDVLYECDLAKFDAVFHRSCNLFTQNGDGTVVTSLAAYRDTVATRKSPSSLGMPREVKVDSVQIAKGGAAIVSLGSRVLNKRFQDYLTFMRGNDGWQIVSKAYVVREILSQS